MPTIFGIDEELWSRALKDALKKLEVRQKERGSNPRPIMPAPAKPLNVRHTLNWEELISIAKDVLDHGPKCQLLRDLKGNSRVKYEHALRLTENMRKKYLGPSKRRTPRSSGRV